MGVVTTRKVWFIPKIEIEYSKDHKEEKGSLHIRFKESSWSINYNFKALAYFPRGLRLINIYLDITSKGLRAVWGKDEKTGERFIKRVID